MGADSWCHLPRAGLAPKAACWAQEPLPHVWRVPSVPGLVLLGSALPAPARSSSCPRVNSGCTLRRRCTLELMCDKQPAEHRRQGRDWKQPFLTRLGSTSSLPMRGL